MRFTFRLHISKKKEKQHSQHIFFFQFVLIYSWFTKLCYFQVYIKVNQLYIHICPLFLFLDSFPIQAITEYWVEHPVLYSRFSLVVLFYISSTLPFKKHLERRAELLGTERRHTKSLWTQVWLTCKQADYLALELITSHIIRSPL